MEFVKVFLDDILIHSRSILEHDKHLAEIIIRLHGHTMAINMDKSSFGLEQVQYLGHIISADGIKADITRIKGLTVPKIKNKRDIQKLTGLLNWFRPFVKNLSIRLAPIYDKLTEEQVTWSEENQKIVEGIINEIQTSTLLHYPDVNKKFELMTDASEVGIGAILIQENKLIGIYSYKFSKSENNYSVVEKEMFAVVKALSHFKQIIYNCTIAVSTDSLNLITEGRNVNRRVNRWKMCLAEFNVTFQHIDGCKNIPADWISRNLFAKSKEFSL